jgi:transglutaminase-like putative cysteine protease
MALMLRTSGIPTRNVTGFLGGTFNRYGRFYAVRQGDAHSLGRGLGPER